MANRFHLDLKTFEVSSRMFDLSLSMTSRAFIYDTQLSSLTQDNLSSLIQTKRLWLLPRGVCRMDVQLRLGECGNFRQERDDFIEFIADTVCQSSVWSQLGLSVQTLDVQYHREEDNIPNLYFGIEQLDMSSALLSPPHAHTAQLKGLECILRFDFSSHMEADSKKEEQTGLESPFSSDHMSHPAGFLTNHQVSGAADSADLWDNAACLVQAAFCVTIGTRKSIRGLSVLELEKKGPSLLDISPSIWNSQYRRSIVKHTKNFAVISNIFAHSLNGQSPELRRKGAELLKRSPFEDSQDSNQHSVRHIESSIERMLWDLLQDTLKPTIGTSNANTKNTISQDPDSNCQGDEINGTIADEGYFEPHELFDENDNFYEELPLASDQNNAYCQGTASTNSDYNLAWQEETTSECPWDNQTLMIPEFYDGMEHFCSEADDSGHQPPESYSQHMKSDLSSAMQDTLVSDYMYDEDDDIYSYEYDCVALAGKGFNDYDPIKTNMPYWEDGVTGPAN
ncbi:hypothetical protein F5Y09DRAFT_351079 [Xylaria sp. FL1042]|nr:hypothetical protein F5Y09DRAFT_351079 [Xylaria sp. FL1042]